jgi:hypothetical protein
MNFFRSRNSQNVSKSLKTREGKLAHVRDSGLMAACGARLQPLFLVPVAGPIGTSIQRRVAGPLERFYDVSFKRQQSFLESLELDNNVRYVRNHILL